MAMSLHGGTPAGCQSDPHKSAAEGLKLRLQKRSGGTEIETNTSKVRRVPAAAAATQGEWRLLCALERVHRGVFLLPTERGVKEWRVTMNFCLCCSLPFSFLFALGLRAREMAEKAVLVLVLVLGVAPMCWAQNADAFVGLAPNGSLVVKPQPGQQVLVDGVDVLDEQRRLENIVDGLVRQVSGALVLYFSACSETTFVNCSQVAQHALLDRLMTEYFKCVVVMSLADQTTFNTQVTLAGENASLTETVHLAASTTEIPFQFCSRLGKLFSLTLSHPGTDGIMVTGIAVKVGFSPATIVSSSKQFWLDGAFEAHSNGATPTGSMWHMDIASGVVTCIQSCVN